MSFQRMLFTYSLVSARGCRSYQSSTSLSVSNTGNLPQGLRSRWLFYDQEWPNGFTCLIYGLGKPLNEDNLGYELNPKAPCGRRRIDLSEVGCRDLACLKMYFCYLLFPMTQLSHVDNEGRIRMVDTGAKEITARRAVASARVLMSPNTVTALREHRTPKGDPLETARLAGIMAAKHTADLIPLCHPLPITHVDVRASLEENGVLLEAEVSTNAQTGVEMEALTAVSIAALTIYDMCKALEKGMTISEVRLERKTGGKSGDYRRL